MKNYAIALLFMFIAGYTWSQEEAPKKVKKPTIPGTFLIDLGVNRGLNAAPSFKQGFWGSRTVNFYYQYQVRFGRSKFSFNPGIGLSMERWKFVNGGVLIDTVELANGIPAATQIEQYDLLSATRIYPKLANKSMFVTNYLEVPLEFRFDTNPEDLNRSFNVALGGRVGILADAFTKVRFNNNGETVKIKDKSNHGLNTFRYGVYTRIGIAGFSWFAFYNLTPMFQKGKGPQGFDMNTFTAGVSINGF